MSISMSWRIMGNPTNPSLNSIGVPAAVPGRSAVVFSVEPRQETIKTNMQMSKICFWNTENKQEVLYLMLPCRHCVRQRNRDGAQELLLFLFYYLDAKAVRITAGRKTTSIYGDNFRSNGFDWGASIVIVFCVISRAAVQMSVFTHNEAKPALCEPTLISSSQKQ